MNRFWKNVEAVENGCWEWRAAKTGSGYGNFFLNGKWRPAHRVSWEMTIGKIHGSLLVLHECDNRVCVNPSHLFLGTAKDNTQDMLRKGRGVWNGSHRGEKHHFAKLNGEKIKEIRKRYSEGGIGQVALAREYGISQSTLGDIVRRATWKHVP